MIGDFFFAGWEFGWESLHGIRWHGGMAEEL